MSNFIGTPGNDTLIGTSGNDNLDGGQGADTMSGLAGNDVYMVDNAGDIVIEAADQGVDRVNSTISYALGPNVEDLWLVGTFATSGTGNALDNVMWGNAADNSLTGLDGNDILDGGAGADTLTGGTGDDTYWVDNVGDVVVELAGQGTDTVKSTLANYTLGANLENLVLLSGAGNINGTGNQQNNEITGNEGDNVLAGGAGNDTLDGGAGADTLIGGAGDDTYRVDNLGDVVVEQAGEGNDTVISTASSFTLPANVENLTLGTWSGSLENLNGYGNELDNTLRGNSGNNILVGGAGNDTLVGGSGNDTLTGGSGNDLFYFSTEDTGTDTITDLASGDVIEICGALFLDGQVTPGNGATVVSGQVQLEVVGNQTILHVGVDATPGADLSIKLDGAFDPGNFHLSGFDIRYDTNHAPSLVQPIPDQAATGGADFSLQLPSDTFSDIDGDPLTYSAVVVDPDWGYLPLPAWLSFNAETRTFHGTPGSSDAGELTVAVLVTDSHDATSSSSFQLSVSPQEEPKNHPPEGSLTISGNLAQGQVLTAVNNLSDADGLGTMRYQWQAGGVAIAGATGSSLTLTQAEVGTAITVAVSYMDGKGTLESVSSAPGGTVANVNDAPTGVVTITGTASQGQTLIASNSLVDADGLGVIRYQWKAGGANIAGATASSYVVTQAEVGKAMTVTASYTDGFGTAESRTSAATATVNQSINAKVHDGYVSGAAIYIDTNGNGIADPTENTGVVTDAQGNFSLTTTLSGALIARGGTNTDTGLTNTLSLAAPQGSGVISPITTLIQSYAKSAGVSASVAETAVQNALGISANVDLTQYDPLSHGSQDATGLSVQQAVAQIAQLGMQSQAEGVSFSTVAQALVTGIQSGKSIDMTSSTQLQGVLGSVVSVQALSTSASNNSTIATANSLQAIASVQMAVTPVAVATFSPADETQGVAVADNIVLNFNKPIQLASGTITLKTPAGTTLATYNAAGSTNLSVSGSTLTIDPSKDLGIFTGYKVEIGAGAVKDLAGNSFAGVSDYNFYTRSLDSLYHFSIVAFSAAPGATFMGQMADAYNAGMTVKQIVEIFAAKPQFTSTYGDSMSNTDFATQLVANVVRDSASAATKTQAINDIVDALKVWTRGDVIYQVFGNLATKPLNDPDWGNTALLFNNQTEVARHFTEVMHNNTTDMATLKAVLAHVTPSTDVSTPAVIATLIGVELAAAQPVT